MKWDEKGIPWYGVDLDGTLAILEPELVSPTYIGDPIQKMVELVKYWNKMGITVKIFTARVSKGWYDYVGPQKAKKIRPAIEKWCLEHLGFILEITAEKDHLMVALYDDIFLYQISRNKGVLHSPHPLALEYPERKRPCPTCEPGMVSMMAKFCPNCGRTLR